MNETKVNQFTAQQTEIAKISKALGHPVRVAIIEHLLQVNACICNDIVNVLPLAQSTVSQHLKELRNAGLIKGEIEGNAICYCLNEKTFELLKKYVSNITATVICQNGC